MPLTREQSRYTYADFLEWDEGKRYEIMDGEAYMMMSPSRLHQETCGNFYYALRSFLEGKTCKVYAAPFAVRLFPAEDLSDDTVVEPDISVVCDSSKLDDRGCNGAPDFIIEIISSSMARYDRIIKFNKYREAGVREYWIVDPEEKAVFTHVLKDGQYTSAVYDDAETVPVTVLPGYGIGLKTVFGTSEARG
jgi:Uma2 family endonuclease